MYIMQRFEVAFNEGMCNAEVELVGDMKLAAAVDTLAEDLR